MDLRPRVLQVVLSLSPGGTERLIIELASRLHASHPTSVCCLDAPGAWAAELTAKEIGVQALQRQPGFQPGLARAIARAAGQHRATVVHAHQYSPFVYTALARAWRPGVPLVFTEHGRLTDALPSPKRRLANRVLSRLATRVVSVSRELGSHMAAEGFPASSIRVIYNGIEPGPVPTPAERLRARQSLGVSDGTVVIGSVGRLDPVKDFSSLIAATILVAKNRPVMTFIVGDGAERQRLEGQVRESQAPSCVKLLGHRDDARQLLPACDVYVNSSVSEGISLTILEAMAAGLPVVATRVGGTPEVVTESAGRLVPARDTEALAGAIAALAADEGLRRSMGVSARARVEQDFRLDRMVREYAELYDSLTRNGAGARERH
jgi:glycosyltransferase involved in cell wall biosynthesis